MPLTSAIGTPVEGVPPGAWVGGLPGAWVGGLPGAWVGVGVGMQDGGRQ